MTDRRDPEKQLAGTATLAGETLTRVRPRGQHSVSSHTVLQETLSRPGKDLVFAMIQKYRGERIDGATVPILYDRLASLTVELVDHIHQEIGIVGFWSRPQARDSLRGWIYMTLDDAEVVPYERIDAVADQLMELAKSNQGRLTQ